MSSRLDVDFLRGLRQRLVLAYGVIVDELDRRGEPESADNDSPASRKIIEKDAAARRLVNRRIDIWLSGGSPDGAPETANEVRVGGYL